MDDIADQVDPHAVYLINEHRCHYLSGEEDEPRVIYVNIMVLNFNVIT